MPLPAVADSLDAIPEPLRTAYVERDGKFVLDADIDSHPAAQGLKRKTDELLGETKAERQKRKELEERVKAYEVEAQQRDLESKGLLDIKKKWDEEILKPVSARLSALEQENQSLKLVGPVKDHFHKAEFLDANDAWTLFGPQFTLDDKGNPIVKDDPTKPIEKHIADLAAAKPWMVKGSQIAGGGAAGAKGGGTPGQPVKVSALKGDDLQAYIAKHGYDAWKAQLDAEALAMVTAKPDQKKAA